MGNLIPSAPSPDFCKRFRVACTTAQDKVDRVWISDRSDLSILNYLTTVCGFGGLPEPVSDNELEELITGQAAAASTAQPDVRGHIVRTENDDQNEARIVKEINQIISSAIRAGASDIHFESGEHRMVCRLRVDGVLVESRQLPKETVPEIISRLKIMSGLDIAEKRRPQDGRIRFPVDGRQVDIRVSVIPTDFGEKAVLRLLDKQSLRLELSQLGFTPQQLAVVKEKLAATNGIVLVTGPTGSGKTTTLYAALQHLKSPQVNISTVEDPIEYNLDGINQTQIRPEINLTFSSMLRAILRQDPNIIMVGEIRDRETLEIAIRASLTGHLVLSTVHTNSAVATVTRLLDMGAEPYLLASSLRLILAQRLLRKLCATCKSPTLSEEYQAAARKLNVPLTSDARTSVGCDACRGTGFTGRTAVYEVLPIDESIRRAMTARSSEEELLALARSSSYATMAETSSSLINTGMTTPPEVLRELST